MPVIQRTILLVEDEAIIALGEKRQLEAAGYRVVHAQTGEKAIEAVAADPAGISLILMDIDLGNGMYGTDAAKTILAGHDIPLLFLSSHMEPELVRRTEEITNYGYVVKSSVFTVLDASIKMAFKLFAAKRQLDLDALAIEDANGQLRASLDELRATNERLAESEDKFSKAFRLNPDSININRLSDGVFLDVNEGFTRIMGYTREDVIGRSSLPGDLGIWARAGDRATLIAGLREKGEVTNLEARFRRKDGTTTIGLMSARIIEIKGEPCIISITRDMGEWIRVEEEAEESNRMLKALLDNLPMGIFMVSAPEGRPLVANEIAKELLGRGILPDVNRESIGEVYQAFVRGSGGRYPLEKMPIIRGLHGESSHIDDMMVIRPDGRRSFLEVYGCPVLDGHGKVMASLVSFLDISDKLRAEEELRTMRSEEKEIILKEMRHRVRNDLVAVESYLSLRIDACSNSEAASTLREAVSQVRGMELLFDKLYGSGEPDRLSANDYLPDLVHEILAVFGDGRSIGTSIEVEDVPVDSRLLSDLGIIVNELVTNSIKHAFAHVAEPRISLSMGMQGDRLKVTYTDNGPGFSPSAPKPGKGGFGLELVRGLVAQHKGTIRVENPGGALFSLEFPASR